MLDFVYYLCIFPLETAMRAVLHAAHGLTGSWGWSVLLLSCAVNIALIPFYHLAESWQEAERAAQKRMAAKLAEIRDAFKGRERDMYTRALRRLHGYSPVLALRASCGLLIQIPFFFAAYHLLHAAPQLAGDSWLFIRDLSLPDGLLAFDGFSLNLLPFAMTAANLLSAAVYTSRLSRRDAVQLYVLAALFLALLYTSSAALLIYWTANNIISLLKNLIYTRFVYTDTEVIGKAGAPAAARPARPCTRWTLPLPAVPARLDLIPAALAAAAFAAAVMLRKRLDVTPPVLACAAAAAAFGILAMLLRFGRLRGRADMQQHLPLFFLILAHLAALAVWKTTSFKRLEAAPSWWFFLLHAVALGALTGWAAAQRPLADLFAKAASFCESRIPFSAAGGLFGSSLLCLALLTCWYTPAALYASDPDFFYESLPELAGRLTLRGLLFMAALGLFFRLGNERLKPFLAAAASWIALAALLFTFAAPGDYGTMDEFLLTNPAPLKSRLAFLVDLAVFACAGLAVWLILRGRKKSKAASHAGAAPLGGLLRGACLTLALMSAWQIWPLPAVKTADTPGREASAKLPDYTDELFGFSRRGQNTVVIMLDMFTGGHMPAILATDPSLRRALDGFVWYRDSIAPGAVTLLSVPAVMGGEEYAPSAVNARKPSSLVEEMHKGFAVLPDLFVPQGYSVALADVEGLEPSLFAKICPAASKTLVVGKSFATAYTDFWRAQKGLPSSQPESQAPFLASVGLFRAAPWVLRPHIYYDGSWLNTQTVIHNPSEGPYALLDSLPAVSNADRTGDTLKYITSMAAHYPWRLDGESCMPIERRTRHTLPDGSISEHVDAERCALRAIVRWLDWMQQNGVYDNTQIILVSDHDGGDSPVYGKPFSHLRRRGVPWKPDALLLVKSRNARGELRTSDAQMSSADALALICAENPCPGVNVRDPRIAPPGDAARTRTHSSGLASIRRHKKDRFAANTFVVAGDGADPANWRPASDAALKQDAAKAARGKKPS